MLVFGEDHHGRRGLPRPGADQVRRRTGFVADRLDAKLTPGAALIGKESVEMFEAGLIRHGHRVNFGLECAPRRGVVIKT
jgi:hypothetical protein